MIWLEQAACAQPDVDPDLLADAFGGASQQQRFVQTLCDGCPVVEACWTYADRHRMQDGAFGGLTEDQRRQQRRQRANAQKRRRHAQRRP